MFLNVCLFVCVHLPKGTEQRRFALHVENPGLVIKLVRFLITRHG